MLNIIVPIFDLGPSWEKFRSGKSLEIYFQNCVETLIITLKTILNQKVYIGYHFCQVILLFWLAKSDSIYEIHNIEEIVNIFIRSSRHP